MFTDQAVIACTKRREVGLTSSKAELRALVRHLVFLVLDIAPPAYIKPFFCRLLDDLAAALPEVLS